MEASASPKSALERIRRLTGEHIIARRERELSDWGTQHACSREWLKDGKSGRSDLLPWLRGVQRMGYELTIIGSSVDALRVCIEAWWSGFRPVMILMEDQLPDNDDDGEEVREMMDAMVSYLGDRGLFRHGPIFIYSDSNRCKVHLDGEGRVTDTLVLTNLAGLNTYSESWQLFKGPAIVVDIFAMPELMELKDEEQRAAEAKEASGHSAVRKKGQGQAGGQKKHVQIDASPSFLGPEPTDEFNLDVPEEEAVTMSTVRNKSKDLAATRGMLCKTHVLQVPQAALPKDSEEASAQAPRDSKEASEQAVEPTEAFGPTVTWSVVDSKSNEEPRAAAAEGGISDAARRAKNFIRRVRKERPTLISAEFWEERNDFDCAPFSTVAPDTIMPLLLLCTLQSFMYVFQYNFRKDENFGWWRALCKFPGEFNCMVAIVHVYMGALGQEMPRRRPCFVCLLIGFIYYLSVTACINIQVGGFWVSDFAASCFSISLILPIMPAYAHFKPGSSRLTKWNLFWFCSTVVGTFGFFVIVAMIVLSYLMLMTVDSSLAGLYLTAAFGAAETGFVVMMLALYNHTVYYPRRKDPNAILGDQKYILSYCILTTHAFTECGRLAALTSGSARASSLDHLKSIVVTVASNILLNVPGRTFWTACLIAKVFGEKRQFWVEMCCPTFITAYHMDCKFAMGWPRFCVFLGSALARGVIFGDFETTWFPTEPDVWCWNGVVLVTVMVMFMAELIEDWFVFIVNGKMPAPVWRYYSEAMVKQFHLPKHSEIFHTSHFLVPHEALPEPGLGEDKLGVVDKLIEYRSAPRAKSVRRTSKHASMHGSVLSDLAERLTASPNFRHCKKMTVYQMSGITGGCVGLLSFGFQVGHGFGNYVGSCWPMKLEGTMLVFLRSLLVFQDKCEEEMIPPWLT
mmetsp:Transcript_90267/g.264045  ORF Transcript_90267/g.264045 Transcript_90267/m.264045 type:complete len:910 (+) Transcript_90267:31-2760(+)